MKHKFRCSRLILLMRSVIILPGILVALVYLPVHAAELPPPPSSFSMPNTTLYLELIVNSRHTGGAVPVIYRDGHYYLTPAQLTAIGLRLPEPLHAEIAIDQQDQVAVSYDGAKQQLLIDVPTAWLPSQRISAAMDEFTPAQSSLGLLLNYDIYASQATGSAQPGNLSAWTEQRLFNQWGVVSNTGVYRTNFNKSDSATTNKGYLRFDTQWRFNNEMKMQRYTAGDVITGSLPWSNSVRIGGFQLARNFNLRSDLITYPLPQFAGQAAVPSTVDVYIDNFKNQSAIVDPGPFVIDNVPRINGAGEATVVTTDALGRQISTSVPFYVANTLLTPGLWDFNLSAGALRRNYGIHSANYGQPVASGVARYGTTRWLTLEGRADIAKKLNVIGGGLSLRLGHFGVLNSAYSFSHAGTDAFGSSTLSDPQSVINDTVSLPNDTLPDHDKGGNGNQRAFGYSYNNSKFSINMQRITRSARYGDLSSYKSHSRLSRRADQINGSIGLGTWGSIGTGYFSITDALGNKTRLVNLSYSTSLFSNTSLYVSLNRELGTKGYSAQLMLSIPLGSWGSSSVSMAKDRDGRWNQRVNYSRGTPSEGGLGWNVAYADGAGGNSRYHQADVTWRGEKIESRGGIYGNQQNYTGWGELSGSLVMMNGGIYPSNRINDAFALVSTGGYRDIPVSYENQVIGHTNDRGYLLVPTVTAYYPAKFQIQPMNLPADVSMPTVERKQAIREQSGYLIDFPITQISAVNLRLIDKTGANLPTGSPIFTTGTTPVSYVGWGGMAYIEAVKQKNKLKVILPDSGQICYAQFTLPRTQGIQNIASVVCQ